VPAGETRRFRITHPFHPFRDRAFEAVEHQEVADQSILFFRDQAGYLAQMPAVWTDFGEADAKGAIELAQNGRCEKGASSPAFSSKDWLIVFLASSPF
jgi:hypothetical protein